jgi:hypothetical protein
MKNKLFKLIMNLLCKIGLCTQFHMYFHGEEVKVYCSTHHGKKLF